MLLLQDGLVGPVDQAGLLLFSPTLTLSTYDGQSVLTLLLKFNNNTRMIFVVLSSMAMPYVRVYWGLLSESQSAPGGCHLIGEAADLILESACRLLWAIYTSIIIFIVA